MKFMKYPKQCIPHLIHKLYSGTTYQHGVMCVNKITIHNLKFPQPKANFPDFSLTKNFPGLSLTIGNPDKYIISPLFGVFSKWTNKPIILATLTFGSNIILSKIFFKFVLRWPQVHWQIVFPARNWFLSDSVPSAKSKRSQGHSLDCQWHSPMNISASIAEPCSTPLKTSLRFLAWSEGQSLDPAKRLQTA